MAKDRKAKPAPEKSPGPRVLRRRKIFESLHDSILEKGYGNTSLQDIANRAGMSASHLCYYFNGKEEVLQEYFGSASNRILEHIAGFSEQEPREQIHSLADFWFKGKIRSTKEIGIMLECFGVAVKDDIMRVAKNEFDESCKAYLIDLFKASPSVLGQAPEDAAEVSYALTIGLRSAVYFDKGVKLKDAHRIFLDTMLSMCGLK